MVKTSIANQGKVFIFCPMGNGKCLCHQQIQPLKKKSLDSQHPDHQNHKVKANSIGAKAGRPTLDELIKLTPSGANISSEDNERIKADVMSNLLQGTDFKSLEKAPNKIRSQLIHASIGFILFGQ